MPFFTPVHAKSVSALSLPETMIALAIGALAISGAMAVNSHQLRLVRATREASAASHAIQERLEQARTATWKQITDPTYLGQTLFSSLPRSIAPLDRYRETITISAWPEGSGPVLCVEKMPKQGARIVSAGVGIADHQLLKVDFQICWGGGEGKRERRRELSTIISDGGISRINLPAMGPLGGGTWEEGSPAVETSTEDGPSESGGKLGRGDIRGAAGTK